MHEKYLQKRESGNVSMSFSTDTFESSMMLIITEVIYFSYNKINLAHT